MFLKLIVESENFIAFDFGVTCKKAVYKMKNPAANGGVSSLEWKFILQAGSYQICGCCIIHIRKPNLTAASGGV